MSGQILTAIEDSILNLANKYKLLTEDSNITYESMKNYEAELQNLISRYNEITGIKNYSTSQQIEETLSQMVNSYNDLLTKIDEVGGSGGSFSFDDLTEEQKEELKGEKGEKGDNGLDAVDTLTQQDRYLLDNLNNIENNGIDILGSLSLTKKEFNILDLNTTNLVAYTSSGSLQIVGKLDKDNDINISIQKKGVNNISTIYAINTQANTSENPINPGVGTWYDIFRASTDNVCAPYQVRAVNNGDSGTANFTGGWHGQNGDLSGLPTAEFVGYTFFVDGIDRTSENNIIRSGIKKVEYTVTHNIMGYNTFADNRFVLKETMKYTFVDGILQLDMEIEALEDIVVQRYYGLQTQANSEQWSDSVFFKNGEYGRQSFITDLDSGNKYSGISNLTSQKGTYELETWVDNTYGLGRRDYVSDLNPSVFGLTSTKKVYQNLVNGIELNLSAGDKIFWRGGWRVRSLDINRYA